MPLHVENWYREAAIPTPSVRSVLSKGATKNGQRPAWFIRTKEGYYLTRTRKQEIDRVLGQSNIIHRTKSTLRLLLNDLTADAERDFLDEAISCYETKAFRAAAIMAWLMTINHLQQFVLKYYLVAFNSALEKRNDKNLKGLVVKHSDDFNDIKEGQFLELCRSANIISNDVRKILDQHLGTRNSAAHPSGVKILPDKVSLLIQDLVENVIKKYPIKPE